MIRIRSALLFKKMGASVLGNVGHDAWKRAGGMMTAREGVEHEVSVATGGVLRVVGRLGSECCFRRQSARFDLEVSTQEGVSCLKQGRGWIFLDLGKSLNDKCEVRSLFVDKSRYGCLNGRVLVPGQFYSPGISFHHDKLLTYSNLIHEI